MSYARSVQIQFNNGYTCIHICSLCDFKENRKIYLLFMCSTLCRESFEHNHNSQSEHIGQWATPHHLSDVRRDAPSWIWDYLAHSDVTIYVLNAIHAILCAIAS